MRCQRCQFENIPGETRCFRCGSILEGAEIAVDIHPPRMARWKKPIRSIFRWIRRQSIFPEAVASPKVPAFLRIMSGNALAGIFLSIIPGLAHFIEGRFREIRWWVLGWIAVLVVGLFFYGGGIGLLFLGFAVGIHSWITFNHMLIREHNEVRERFIDFGMLLVFFGLLYFGFRMTVLRDFVLGFSSRTIPYQKVEAGDIMLARRSRARADFLKRGSFVLVALGEVRAQRILGVESETIAQVVAVGGETVDINGVFVVNGRPLDVNHFPVPQWLQGRRWSVSVPKDSYFINVEYNTVIHGNAELNAGFVERACVIPGSRIEATAVMKWLPVSRRGCLKADE
jgi:hypothetical protein